jgi:hypothetical protein
VGRVIKAGLCTWVDMKAGLIGWADIWAMHDMLDLSDWLDWQHHAAAERDRS